MKFCYISFYEVFTENLDPVSFQSNRELSNQAGINFEESSLGHIAINYNIISYFKTRTSRIFQVKGHNRYCGMIREAQVNKLQ
jgi:hypothetical protein